MGTQRAKIIKTEEPKIKSEKTAAKSDLVAAAASEKAALARKKAHKATRSHGRNYQKMARGWDLQKTYSPAEAIELLKKYTYTKFDPTVEAHFKLGVLVEKGEPALRTTVNLPHGTGKEVKVLLFAREKVDGADISGDETTIERIESGELKIGRDFQTVVAVPELMAKIARLGKILGPKGLMPNPKNGTVTSDPAKIIQSLKGGQLELKAEANAPLLHTRLGKLSFQSTHLVENLQAVVHALKTAKPSKTRGEYLQALTLSSTMGPGIKADLSSLK